MGNSLGFCFPKCCPGPGGAAFGVGAGLTLDEFALWVRLEDVYWTQQGRESLDAVVVGGDDALAGLNRLVVNGEGFPGRPGEPLRRRAESGVPLSREGYLP